MVKYKNTPNQKVRAFYFTIDQRSLGLFRLLLGWLLIRDWIARWPNLEAFYTSFGALPIEAPLPKAGGIFHFSLLDGATSLPMVQGLFWLGLLCYGLFLIGYRTRSFHILSFLFFSSVLSRNILPRAGNDMVLLTLLIWTLFLPLGNRFSVDAMLKAMRRGVPLQRRGLDTQVKEGDQQCEPCLAAFVIICQIALIYFMTAFAKSGASWKDGTAVYYTMHIDQLIGPLGERLAHQPLWFLKGLTWGTLGLEYLVAPLLLVPVARPLLRRIAIVSTTGMHLGIWLTMRIGDFPLVMISSSALLLGEADWAVIRRWALLGARRVTAYYDDTCGFCYRVCQFIAIADWGHRIRFVGSRDTNTLVALGSGTRKKTKSAAMAAIFQALPFPFHLFRFIALPGISAVSDAFYDFVARHRYRYSEWLGFTECGVKQVREVVAPTAPVSAWAFAWRRTLKGLVNSVVALLFISVLIDSYNINMTPRLRTEKIPEPSLIRAIIQCPQIVHDWKLFAPDPMKQDGWWVIDGVTESGEAFDPLTGTVPTWEKPKDLGIRYDRFWRKYLSRIWLKEFKPYRLYFAKYITRKNHREKPVGQRLATFKFYYVRETTQPPGSKQPFPTDRILVWKHNCFARSRPQSQKPGAQLDEGL